MIAFQLTETQEEKLIKWTHQCNKNGGAIGGKFSFLFVPTTLGTCIEVKCICGEKLNLTESEDW